MHQIQSYSKYFILEFKFLIHQSEHKVNLMLKLRQFYLFARFLGLPILLASSTYHH